MRELWRAAWRQRRLALFFGAMLIGTAWMDGIATGQMAGLGPPPEAPTWQTAAFAALVAFVSLAGTLILAAPAVLFGMLLPAWRLILVVVPLVLLACHLPLPQPWPFAVMIAALFCFVTFLERPTLDPLLPTIPWRTRRRFRTRAAPQDVLTAAIPALGDVSAYWGPLWDAAPVEGRPGTFSVRYAHGKGAFQQQEVEHLAVSPERAAYRYRDEGTPALVRQSEGVIDATVGPADARGRRLVTVEETRPAMPPRMALLDWLLDVPGGEADAVAAHAEGRRTLSAEARLHRAATAVA